MLINAKTISGRRRVPISLENSQEGLDQLCVPSSKCQSLLLSSDVLEQKYSVLFVLHEKEKPYFILQSMNFYTLVEQAVGEVIFFVAQELDKFHVGETCTWIKWLYTGPVIKI